LGRDQDEDLVMTAALAPVALRLGQLVRLLGSDKDGEVLAAARALGRTLETVGQDFHALADIVERSVERSPAVHHHHDHHHEYADHRATARWIINSGARLSPKEMSFGTQMANRFGTLSERQEAWLMAIFERAASENRRAS
jgi:hypothetical protein